MSKSRVPAEIQERKSPITFVVLTLNEERNVGHCLQSLMPWAEQVFVLDSCSNDDTLAIAQKFGAAIVQRSFDNYSAHRNWALENLPFRAEWVFFLDADEWVPEPLRREVTCIVQRPDCPYDGYYVRRRIVFFGKWLRHGGWYPNVALRFFKHQRGRWESRLVHEHLALDGAAGYLQNDLINEDHKGLDRFFERHNTYSSFEAYEMYRCLRGIEPPGLKPRLFGPGPERRRWLKEMAYRFVPCRPMFKFVWLYVLRGCFLDGRMGFRHSVLQAFYEYQVSLKLHELRSEPSSVQNLLVAPVAMELAGGQASRTGSRSTLLGVLRGRRVDPRSIMTSRSSNRGGVLR